MLPRVARAVAILALYLVCIGWLTWPLATHLATHRPNTNPIASFDTVFSAWMLAYETHALATDPRHLPDANIYAPTPRALFYGQTGFGALPFFAPVYLLSGNPILALNVTFLVCCALTAAAIHAVVARWTGSDLAGMVGGIALLTDRCVPQLLPLAPQYAALPYLPLIVYFGARPTLARAHVFLLAALIALQSLTDPVYFAPAVLAPLLVLAGVRLARGGSRAAGGRVLAAIGIAMLALLPLYAEYFQVRAENPDLAQQTVWSAARAAKMELPLVLPWGLLMSTTAIPLAALAMIFAGVTAVGLAGAEGADASERAGWRHASLWVVVGFLISLPAAITLPDVRYHVVLPYDTLARWIPLFETVRRGQGRLRIDAMIGLCLLAGLGFAAIARRLPPWPRRWKLLTNVERRALAASVVMLMLGEYVWGAPVAALGRPPLSDPYPIAEMPSASSSLVAALRRSSGPVVELTGMSPVTQAAAMYRSTFHWRPLVNGYSSYWPVGFPELMTLARHLPDPQALTTLRRETNVTSIVVPLWKLSARERQSWMQVVQSKRPDLRLAAADATSWLFDVVDPGAPSP